MKRLVCLLLAAACGGQSKPASTSQPATAQPAPPAAEDDCARVYAKLAPVIAELVAQQGKTFEDADREKLMDDCRAQLAEGNRDPMIDCVLAAADEAGVRTCFADALAAYRDKSRAVAAGCADAASCRARAQELEATDPDRATEAYYAACMHGDGEGCEQAGLRWMKVANGKQPHPLDPRIVDSWRRSCEIGTGLHGCGNLGSAYYFGLWSTPVDGKRGIELWTKSCKQQGNEFICGKLEQAKAGKIKPGVMP